MASTKRNIRNDKAYLKTKKKKKSFLKKEMIYC